MSDIIQFLSFSVLLHTNEDNLQVHLHCCKWHYFLLSYGWYPIISMYYIFIHFSCQWTFRLLSCLGYCKYAAVNIGVHYLFELCSGYMPKSRIAGSYDITSHWSDSPPWKSLQNSTWWGGCGEKGSFLHCWWECKLLQPLWRTVWRVLKKIKIKLPYDRANTVFFISNFCIWVVVLCIWVVDMDICISCL